MASATTKIDLLAPIRLLHAHLTAALCATVFQRTRVRERERVWSLHRLAEFWTAVILRAPASLTHALEETGGGASPAVSSQGFFSRCQNLRFDFFRDLFEAFVASASKGRAACFDRQNRALYRRFTGVPTMDSEEPELRPTGTCESTPALPGWAGLSRVERYRAAYEFTNSADE